PAPRQRPSGDASQLVVAAGIVERLLLGPHAREDLEPLAAARVAVVVRILLEPEHVELVLVPAADDVEAEAALTDVVGGHDLLRRQDRWKDRHVDGAEDGEVPRRGEQPARPGD